MKNYTDSRTGLSRVNINQCKSKNIVEFNTIFIKLVLFLAREAIKLPSHNLELKTFR